MKVKYTYYFHFTEDEIEAPKGKGTVQRHMMVSDRAPTKTVSVLSPCSPGLPPARLPEHTPASNGRCTFHQRESGAFLFLHF